MEDRYLHINCDLGEGGSVDQELMPLISACNIATGGHAGTLERMRETVDLAMKYQVQIGAHPSYPDKENFGRISLAMSPADLEQSVMAQILSLKQIVEAQGGVLTHIKPHGALYHDASTEEATARSLVKVLLQFEENYPVFAPENSWMSRLASGRIKVIPEAFADRNYQENYRLVPRDKHAALITEKQDVLQHLSRMFLHRIIRCESGREIPCHAATFCLHSDTPKAVEILKYLHGELGKNGIKITRYER